MMRALEFPSRAVVVRGPVFAHGEIVVADAVDSLLGVPVVMAQVVHLSAVKAVVFGQYCMTLLAHCDGVCLVVQVQG